MKKNSYIEFEQVEDKFKKEAKEKRKYKVSGKSVFKLEKIIRGKNEKTS